MIYGTRTNVFGKCVKLPERPSAAHWTNYVAQNGMVLLTEETAVRKKFAEVGRVQKNADLLLKVYSNYNQ